MGRHVEGGSIRWEIKRLLPGYWRARMVQKDYGWPYDWEPVYHSYRVFGSQTEAFAYAWGQIKKTWKESD
jgi:hypothetical protein